MSAEKNRLQGYVPMWKSTQYSAVFEDGDLFRTWFCMLCDASHVARRETVGTTTVNLKPGDFVYRRNTLVQRLSKPLSTVRNLVEKLKALDQLEDVTEEAILERSVDHPKVTVLRIKNWENYRAEGMRSGTISGTKRGTISGTTGQPISRVIRKEGLPSVNPSKKKTFRDAAGRSNAPADRSGGWTVGEDGTLS